MCVSQGVSLTGGVALAVPPASSWEKKRLVLAEVNFGFTLTSMGAPIQHQSRLSYSGELSAQKESCKAMQCAAQFENASCSQGWSAIHAHHIRTHQNGLWGKSKGCCYVLQRLRERGAVSRNIKMHAHKDKTNFRIRICYVYNCYKS